MKILLLGSGGRECTLAWKLAQSPLCAALYIAPGNGGTLRYGTNVPINPQDFAAVAAFCIEHHIDILLPGNEDPLVAGIWDHFKADDALKKIIIVGPSKDGAILEGSKDFSKEFMQRHGIPTATYQSFGKDNYDDGIDYLRAQSLPIVIKADGLAAGKGVIIAYDMDTAIQAYDDMLMHDSFGTAGARVVIESFLDGIEVSMFVLTDGDNYLLLPEAKDYKRIGEGDTGPNTGGMGTISPVPIADESFVRKVEELIVKPTVRGLREEGRVYQGFIFFGLIRVGDEPFVIEYNCRLGDPETEVIIPRIKNDLVSLILSMEYKTLQETKIVIDDRATAAVMLVSEGYPGEYALGKAIDLPLSLPEDTLILHAGTKVDDTGSLLTNGGRVMAVTSYGTDIAQALDTSYKVIDEIEYEGKTYRKDIGYEFVNR